MKVLFGKPLKITTESGSVYTLGETDEDGLRTVSREGSKGPLPFSRCALGGCGRLLREITPEPKFVLERNSPTVGLRLRLFAEEPFIVDAHSLPDDCCVTTPIVKIENC